MIATRRDFLKTSLATGSLVSWGLTVPAFLSRTAAAAPDSGKPGAKETFLVVVQLTGGNDGL
ncbi:MAG TPA: twin-arginine translocation signal domain-containing protein, partial [Gemmataceae bacterium]|nr:twin-arginine translocation signal domain-containing protein [Gemmataceae bacterium]